MFSGFGFKDLIGTREIWKGGPYIRGTRVQK